MKLHKFKFKLRRPNFLKEVSIVLLFAVFSVFVAVLIILFIFVRDNDKLKKMAGGTSIGNIVFCSGQDLCEDGRCVNETWRECIGCSANTSRVVYKMDCNTEVRSECEAIISVCED